MTKTNRRLRVIENRPLSPDVFLLTLGVVETHGRASLQNIKPGQFANILVENAPNVFLRRPFSIHDVDLAHNFIKFFIQKVGKGTEQLAKLKSGDGVEVVFPLGNGFSMENGKWRMENEALPIENNSQFSILNSQFLLVGGGVGVAPLLYLAKFLKEKGISPTILIGGRSKKNIFRIEEYVKYGKVLVITEDGSLGEKGVITEHSIFQQQAFDQIYCCGPDAMMKAVGKLAMEKNIPCQVSLENTMACGVGACLCCVTKTVDGHLCVCTDGPVFDFKQLV